MRGGAALFLVGALAGGIAVSVVNAGRLDRLYLEKEKIRVELFETADRLHKLEKRWAGRSENLVRAVIIELATEAGAFDELSLQQAAAAITADLVGKSVSTLHPHLLLNLLDGRLLSVNGKFYRLSVNWIIIGEEVIVNLDAAPAAG